MPGSMPISDNERRLDVSNEDSQVTTTVAGANGYETIWDLSPATDIYYWLLQDGHPQVGSEGNLRIRMQLPQEGGGSTEIGDNARVRLIAQDAAEEDVDQLGRSWRYRRFSQASQYDADDVVRLQLEDNVKITEAGHLKLQVDNSTNGNDVDLSQTGGYATVEMFRGTER